MNLLLSDGEHFAVHFGDCIPHMADMPAQSVDFAVFSPPFPSLFAYTSSPADIGNSEDLHNEAKLHFSFFFNQLIKVIKPGRVVIVHCCQIPGMVRNNQRGTFDFRGLLIRLGLRAGFHYQYDWLVGKNPQSQAIRTHSHRLMFVSMERDRAIMAGAFGDYLIKFLAPGENTIPIDSPNEISRNDWINWAECCWTWQEVRETDTLNVREAKGDDDTKHICPLQIGVIDRLVRLYTNPGEIVFSPFAGIGSEGYVALKNGRRFYGCELKREYYDAMLNNLGKALASHKEDKKTLFDLAEAI